MKRQALKIFCSLLLAFTPAAVSAAGGGAALDAANNDLSNTASLQRGAKYFVNYCLGCHSLQYVRYNSLMEDLDLTEEQVMQNLAFTAEKPTEMMTIAMDSDDAERWFGVAPPDLSLTARSRGADWIYTYLRSFYLDESRPFGVNNSLLKGASMPHVLAPLQGYRKIVYETETDASGNEHQVFKGFEQVTEGELTEQEYNQVVRDITNFLDYVGEPVQLERRSLGIGVLAFLIIFFLFAYFLKREIWKDLH